MRYVGTFVAFGFIGISAASNFLFAFSLARSPLLAAVYGSVGVLATLANAYIPIRMLEAWDCGRKSVLACGAVLLLPCMLFSIVSALGFASSVREVGTAEQAALSANYALTQKQLADAESAKKPDPKRIDELRNELKRYNVSGAQRAADPQAATFAAFGIQDARYYINLLFALLAEMGAALGLFIVYADLKRGSIPTSLA